MSVGIYAATVAAICRWLAAGSDDWRRRFPPLAGYPHAQFDCAGEDSWFARASLAPDGRAL